LVPASTYIGSRPSGGTPRSRSVQLKLADRDRHAVGAQIAEAEDAAAIGRADKTHVFDRPVAQNLPDVPFATDRQVHPARAPQNLVEPQRSLADRRVIHDLQEASRVRHQGAVEERLIRFEQIHQVNEPFEVVGFAFELLQDTAELSLDRLRHIGHQPD
jgi:hypothetical protein